MGEVMFFSNLFILIQPLIICKRKTQIVFEKRGPDCYIMGFIFQYV